MTYEEITTCRLCGSDKLFKYLELEDIHLVNKFTKLPTNMTKYPLAVNFCRNCTNSQLTVKVPPEEMFDEYTYFSSVSSTFKQHCYGLAVEALDRLNIPQPKVLDIASNDGCLLTEFKLEGADVLGVDPAKNIANEATAKGLPTIIDYWGTRVAKQILKFRGPMNVITAQNVLAHVDNQRDFIEAVSLLLAPEGLFIVEFPHASNFLKQHQFDTVYHEHGCYLTLHAVKTLANEFGLELYDASEQSVHGGSLRLTFRHAKEHWPQQSDAARLWKEEADSGLWNIGYYDGYQEKVNDLINKERTRLKQLEADGLKGVWFGASAKGTVLMNNLGGVGPATIIDETPAKQNKYLPNIFYRVIPLPKKEDWLWDYVYATPWNFKEEIREKLKHYNTEVIFPFEEQD